MQIVQTNKLPEWSSDDANTLRDFMTSTVGSRALAHVLSEKPALLDGGDVNKTLVRNGEVKGFELATESLFKLTYEQPTAERPADSQYPDLDNEKAWEQQQPTAVETTN